MYQQIGICSVCNKKIVTYLVTFLGIELPKPALCAKCLIEKDKALYGESEIGANGAVIDKVRRLK